jgi:hypothetical protein
MTTVRASLGEPGSAQADWRLVIQAVQTLAHATGENPVFGEPISIGRWWAGGIVEEYLDARIILPGPGRAESEGVLITSKTPRAERLLRRAAEQLDIRSLPEASIPPPEEQR